MPTRPRTTRARMLWLLLSLLTLTLVVYALGLFSGIAKSDLTPYPPRTEVGQVLEGAGRANFDWFKRRGVRFAVAFRAEKDGEITQLALPWRTTKKTTAASSYGWGTYGSYTFSLHGSTADQLPDDTVLASADDIFPTAAMHGHDDFPLVVPLHAKLTQGQLYHLVITNTDPTPEENWSSLNTVMTRVTPWKAWAANGSDARGLAYQDGRWSPWCSLHNPWNTEQRNDCNGSRVALVLSWADGTTTGDPYWSAAVEDPARIEGAAAAGERIVWQHPTTSISRIGLSVARQGAPRGMLYYHLDDLTGNELVSGILATPEQVLSTPTWVYATLPHPISLTRGASYRLWFASPESSDADNCYRQSPIYCPGDIATGWPALSWGGTDSCYIFRDDGEWNALPTHDLSFSLCTAD